MESGEIHSNNEEFDVVAPHAESLVESLRAFGYELPTAIADLVDNSITAGARNIWIDFKWDGSESAIIVTDDGDGMTESELISAMRLGSQSPRVHRASHDLGRFGLGLKTASFSQCRRVTVRTACGGTRTSATRCWDLDHIAKVKDWQLLRFASASSTPHFNRFHALDHGTTVVWQVLDRLVSNQSTDSEWHQQLFLKRAEAVRQHLSVVFHQLMTGRRAVQLYLNDRLIEPWDPFLLSESATQTLPLTNLKLKGELVQVEPFILPHHSKLTKPKHERGAGPRGWNAHQGFYIYRNRRLLVPGDWLGFGWAKEEHYKLARIRVEIPNALDYDWEIDVTKSKASPPTSLRDELRKIGERTRSDAKRVYGHRGAKLTAQSDASRVLLWEPLAKHDKTFYRINRAHPLLKLAFATCNDKSILSALIRLAEETIPFPHITISNTEKPDHLPGPFEHSAEAQIREVMEQAFSSLTACGYGPKEAVNRLRTIWPFELFPALLQTLKENHDHA